MTVSLVKAFTDSERDEFIAGYCEAMLWANTTNEEDPDDDSHVPSDWASPNPDWALDAFDVESARRIVDVCDAFMAEAYALLRQALRFDSRRTMAHMGHDLALTAAHHGAGYWDRGYPSALGEALTSVAHMYAAEASFGADGVVHYDG